MTAVTTPPRRRAKVVVLGQGHVGLPLAVAAAENGYGVVGYDSDPERVRTLAGGLSPIPDVTSTRLAQLLGTGRYRPTDNAAELADFDIAVITVPTPLNDERLPDLGHVETAAVEVGRRLRPGCLVILESTSFPGTTEEVLAPILRKESGLEPGADFALGFSPERIDPGNVRWTIETTPKVVSGIDAESLARTRDFYGGFLDDIVAAGTPKVAELAKVFENTFRQVNIALVNELAIHADRLGIDVWQALEVAGTKPFGFMKFLPGPGVGGHCLPIDPVYLYWKVAQETGRPFRMVELADDINSEMPGYVVSRLERGLRRRDKALPGARVLAIGLAYKPNVSDARCSPALEVCRRLVATGAEVHYADALIADKPELSGLVRSEPTAGDLQAADAVVILTDHDYVDYDLVVDHASYVLDCRRRLPGHPHVELL
ncbi:nucleotide sugar dehydrogenase [Nocardia sp. CDC159]|uniref:Nucleotide sugar dehydrogenase n=1 Tax=Nocardia pulmonis TaxID=2951408 RepID=A0A9X2E3T8_9NOCA|nr:MULTISPECIES: nucleotide sugar dehydrogenase [Nocardia]MCM6773135.1 nucleotide sugar dehydrogenase [Nocardia pulmonis]MCM6785562.1 nucleotide sugar dehydrogenase [Nocardia sp. CDC159]